MHEFFKQVYMSYSNKYGYLQKAHLAYVDSHRWVKKFMCFYCLNDLVSHVMQVTQSHFCEGQVCGRGEGIACRFTAWLCLAYIVVLHNVSLMVCSICYGVYT